MTRKISEETKEKNRARALLYVNQNPEKNAETQARFRQKRKQEFETLRQQIIDLQKENETLKKKLEEYERGSR